LSRQAWLGKGISEKMQRNSQSILKSLLRLAAAGGLCLSALSMIACASTPNLVEIEPPLPTDAVFVEIAGDTTCPATRVWILNEYGSYLAERDDEIRREMTKDNWWEFWK
jgi:hypothetical protein